MYVSHFIIKGTNYTGTCHSTFHGAEICRSCPKIELDCRVRNTVLYRPELQRKQLFPRRPETAYSSLY